MSAFLFRGWEFEKINKAEFFVLYKLKIQIYIYWNNHLRED